MLHISFLYRVWISNRCRTFYAGLAANVLACEKTLVRCFCGLSFNSVTMFLLFNFLLISQVAKPAAATDANNMDVFIINFLMKETSTMPV